MGKMFVNNLRMKNKKKIKAKDKREIE